MLTFNHLIMSVLSITIATTTLTAALLTGESLLQEKLLQNLLSGKQDLVDFSYQQSPNPALQDDMKKWLTFKGYSTC